LLLLGGHYCISGALQRVEKVIPVLSIVRGVAQRLQHIAARTQISVLGRVPKLRNTPGLRSSRFTAQPELMRQQEAKIDTIVEYAKKVRDWPLLDEAVTVKIDQQREFVRWWMTM